MKEHVIEVAPGDIVNVIFKDSVGLCVVAMQENSFNVQGLYPDEDALDGENWRCEAVLNADDWPDITFKLFEVGN